MPRPPISTCLDPSVPNASRRVAIVGNAPEIGDHSAAIDSADIVVRFNNTHGLGGVTGSKTTYLFLVNTGGQMREWLDDRSFTARPAVRDADAVYLPIDPSHVDRFDPPLTPCERAGAEAEDMTSEAVARLTRAGKRVELLSARAFEAACRSIGTRLVAGMAPPSTGYLATHYLLRTLGRAGCRVEAYGFGFEGYEAHAWDAEWRWFQNADRDGRLHLVPPASTVRAAA